MNNLRLFLARTRGRAITDLLLLAIVFSIVFFHTLGKYPLMDPDEGRYAEIPREMLERGDFVTPHFNYAKFFDKPPLLYWMTAASFTLFGENETAARLPGAVCGLLTVMLTYLFGRALMGRREGLLSALVLATSGGYFICARLVIIDMPLVLFMEAALGCFLLGARGEGRSRGLYFYLFYVFTALAMLTKGPVGVVLPAMTIFFHLLITRRWRLLREMRLLSGGTLFLLVCLPWFVLISVRHPEFLRYFFFREHVERFLTTTHRRYEGVWFYIPILFGMAFPWSCLLPLTAAHLWRERKSRHAGTLLFLALWAICIFVFFSVSGSQLPTYILPAVPALALLTGAALSGCLDALSRWARRQLYAVALILCAGGAAGALYPLLPGAGDLNPIWCLTVGSLIIAGGLLSLRQAGKGDTAGSLLAICATIYAIELLGMQTIPSIFVEERTTKTLALAARERAEPGAVIVSYMFEPSLAFYTGRRLVLADIGNKGELEFGSEQPGAFDMFITAAKLVEMWDSPAPVIALMKDDDAEWLRERVKAPVSVIARQGERIMTINRPTDDDQ